MKLSIPAIAAIATLSLCSVYPEFARAKAIHFSAKTAAKSDNFTTSKSTSAAARVPRIGSSVQFPQSSRGRIVRHVIRIQIPPVSQPLSQLKLHVPSGLIVSDRISISVKNSGKIEPNISLDGSTVTFLFPQPVPPGTQIKIALKDVKISGGSRIWLYPVSVRLVGIDADLPIGMARFQSRR